MNTRIMSTQNVFDEMIILFVDPTEEWSIFQTDVTDHILLCHETCDSEAWPPGSVAYMGNEVCWKCGKPIPAEIRRKWQFLNNMHEL